MAWSSEPTGLVLRDARFGDPFQRSVFVVGDEGVATLKGLTSHIPFTRQDWDEITTELRVRGFHTLRYSRKTQAGGTRWMVRPIVNNTEDC